MGKIVTTEPSWSEIFKPIFGELSIYDRLKEIEPIRNAISHSRDLDKLEDEKLQLFAQEILNVIQYYQKYKTGKMRKIEKQKKPTKIISVSFDRTKYPLNSTVYLRANIPEIIPNEKIYFTILDAKNNEFKVKSLDPEKYDKTDLKETGIYETSFTMKGNFWKIDEKYRARCIHGKSQVFDETEIKQRIPQIETDTEVYLWEGDMIITVIDPDADKDSNFAEFVGDKPDSQLVISSSKGFLKNYRLRETGDSTGIFQGLLGFIGLDKSGRVNFQFDDKDNKITKTQGIEFDDGYIEVSDYDTVKLSYTNSAGTTTTDVLVIQDIAE